MGGAISAEILQEQAWSTGKTVCDWARECITQQLGQGSQKSLDAHIFTELVGIQLLLMNTLGPIARGERMAAEEVDIVFRQVQTRKAGKAQEILNKRLTRELQTRSGTQSQNARTEISQRSIPQTPTCATVSTNFRIAPQFGSPKNRKPICRGKGKEWAHDATM